MHTRRVLVIALILISPLAASFAQAQPLSDRVPADSLLYIGWQGSESMPASFANSHAKALLDASNIPKVFNEMVPQLVRRLNQENPQAADGVKIVLGIAAPLWRHPAAIYSTGVEFGGNAAPPIPHAAILCEAGNEADALAEQFGK